MTTQALANTNAERCPLYRQLFFSIVIYLLMQLFLLLIQIAVEAPGKSDKNK